MRKVVAALTCAGLMAGFANATAGEGDQAAFEALMAEAKAARATANKAGGEWRDVGKFLKGAAKAAKAGDMKKAMKLAAKAKSQSELGLTQAEAQKSAGHPSYLK